MESSKSQTKLPGKRSIKLKESEKHSLHPKINKPKHAKMKTYSLEHVKDKFIGAKGTPKRNSYENELRLDLLGEKIRQTRIKKISHKNNSGNLLAFKRRRSVK